MLFTSNFLLFRVNDNTDRKKKTQNTERVLNVLSLSLKIIYFSINVLYL